MISVQFVAIHSVCYRLVEWVATPSSQLLLSCDSQSNFSQASIGIIKGSACKASQLDRPFSFNMWPTTFRAIQRVGGTAPTRSLHHSAATPRHLMSIGDLTPAEFTSLVRNASSHKVAVKSGGIPRSLNTMLTGKTVPMMFSKRSTRTRVSTEAAVALMGGHPMFLGKEDIQLGVRDFLLK